MMLHLLISKLGDFNIKIVKGVERIKKIKGVERIKRVRKVEEAIREIR